MATTRTTSRKPAPPPEVEVPETKWKQTWKGGNLTDDPELRFGQSGMPYARFGLAVNSPKVPGDWGGEQETTYYQVTCFRSLAENVAESLCKGHRVLVGGRGGIESWAGEDGTIRAKKVIQAEWAGPDLRFATVEIIRGAASAPRTSEPDDGEEDPF